MNIENLEELGRLVANGVGNRTHSTDPGEIAALYQKRAALCFWFITKYREWGDDPESLIALQYIHRAESRIARKVMGIET